jgi:glycine/D-amino acid oxidase-like deaminating enzyme
MLLRRQIMLNENSPVQFSDSLPKSVDVVVIGAGIIGISTAWFLSQRGLSVAVCEKGRVAGEQSSRNWGWIRKHGRDRAELPIVIEALEHWQSFAKQLDEDIGFERHGVLYLAENEHELAARERWLSIARDHDLDTKMVGKPELGQLLKNTPQGWIGGAYTASDARAEPFLAVPALARAAQNRGVSITEECAARTLDFTAGSVSGVVTELGLIKCHSVVCAGGAWSSLFCRHHGFDFPQLTVRASVARTAPGAEIFKGSAAGSGIAFRKRTDGGYTLAANGFFDHYVCRDSFRYFKQFLPTIGRAYSDFSLRFTDGLIDRLKARDLWSADTISPFERERVLNPDPSPAAIAEIGMRVKRYLPALADLPLIQTWAGMIDTTPDIVPVMDRVPNVNGLFVAAGFSGHGFGIGPGAGRIMADMVSGNALGHDVSRFRLSRFSDGSKLEIGPAI